MYSTCLFCHGDLGKNAAIEHFPVGRRLAFDELNETFTHAAWRDDQFTVDALTRETGEHVKQIADICAMPEIASGGFDAVVASGVLSFVHDFDAALGEIHRVLAEGGVFLHCEVNYGFNQRTEEISDREKIAAWYGRDALEQKK